MTHANKEQRGPQPDSEIEPVRQPAVEPARDPDAAWTAIEEILAGKSDAASAVKLAAKLDEDHKLMLADKLPDLAKVATGDVVIGVGEALGTTPAHVLKAALSATRAKPTVARLQKLVVEIDGAGLDALSDGHAIELEKVFAGAPFLQVFPRTTFDLARKPIFLRWLVRSTPPVILANIMGVGGSEPLAHVLDEQKLWRPWIDHIRHSHDRYALLAGGTADPAIRAKLLAPFGNRASVGPNSEVELQAGPEGGGDIDAVVATGASLPRLIEALNGIGSIPEDKVPEIQAALKRMRAPADDVLGVALRAPTSMSWVSVLAAAPGLTSAHVLTYAGSNRIDIETIPELVVRQLRGHLGSTFPLAALVRRDDARSHRIIVESEPLRQWFFDKATPADLLWFCTFTPDLNTRATRAVVGRFPGYPWVRKLEVTEDTGQLRALALACNDAATKKFIHDDLLKDAEVTGKVGDGPDPSSRAFEGEERRLKTAIAVGDPEKVMERLADLDDAERTEFGRNPKAVADLVEHANLDSAQFARAAHLLQLSAEQSLLNARGPAILPHVHSRPAAELAKAVASPAVVANAAKSVYPDLLVVFPSLANRAVLAKAVDDNPSLVEHLLRGGDGARVMDLLAVEPVATAAIAAFEQDASRVRLIPAVDHLSDVAAAFVARIRKAPDADSELRTQSKHVLDRDYGTRMKHAEHDPEQIDALERGKAAADVSESASLADALDELFIDSDRKPRHGPSNIVALLASRKAEVPTLLSEATYDARVRRIAYETRLPPHLALPFISSDLLLEMPNALHWYFKLEDPMVLLHLAGRPNAANTIGQNLGADTPGARDWLRSLPHGAALTREERRLIDLLQRATQNGEVLRQLFITRFDVTPPPLEKPGEKPDARGAGYDAGQFDSLYGIASRLPDSHVNQKRINRIAAQDTINGTGSWDGQVLRVDPDVVQGNRDDTMHSDANANAPDEGWLTRDEVVRDFGYDDARIAAQVKAANLVEREVDGTKLYKMKPVTIDLFTQVVLHEIGHSVDSMLGAHTSLVYQQTGWRHYTDAQFDEWAAEMGGWDKVDKGDKAKIKEAWFDASRSNKPVSELVGHEHPAMSEKYQDVGLVAAGREGASFYYTNRTIRNGRMFVAGSYPGYWSSLKAEAVPSAPSDFSLYAPGEYFAESYVEYYRNVDGSPGSEKKKGGGLSSAAKKFFDEHVDNLKYDPRRFESPEPDA